jgi:acyl-CoA thioester hydrolase
METTTKLTVRYAETDQMGIVHHSNYPVWFEAGRTDFLKQAGASYSDVEAQGVLLPLYELTCRYKSPAKYEDEVAVVTRIKELTRVRLILSYEVILQRDGTLLASGETLHAFTDRTLKPVNAEKAAPELYRLLREAALEAVLGK